MPRITRRLAPLALSLLLMLLACAPAPPQAVRQTVYRNTRSPIYSTAALPLGRLLGDWQQVAGLGSARDCPPAPLWQLSAKAGTGQPWTWYDLCLGGARRHGSGALASAGAAGRYHLPGLPSPVWVLWLSSDATALAIGTPDGSYAAVLSKSAISADKLQAAKQVLAWNGYDLAQFYQ